MTDRTMNLILEAADVHGFEMVGHADYSGRSTYGRTTCAVSYDQSRELLLCVALIAFTAGVGAQEGEGRADHEALTRDLAELRFDDFGRGTIAY